MVHCSIDTLTKMAFNHFCMIKKKTVGFLLKAIASLVWVLKGFVHLQGISQKGFPSLSELKHLSSFLTSQKNKTFWKLTPFFLSLCVRYGHITILIQFECISISIKLFQADNREDIVKNTLNLAEHRWFVITINR